MPERARTFAAGLALTNMRRPSILAWLGLVSYSAYFMPPELDVCDKIPFPRSYGRSGRCIGSFAAVPLDAPFGGQLAEGQARTCWGYWRAH